MVGTNGAVNGGSHDGEVFYSERNVVDFVNRTGSIRGSRITEQYRKSFHFWVEDGVGEDWYEWDLV